MDRFRDLRELIPGVVSYLGGKTVNTKIKKDMDPPEYDSIHCLTHRCVDDIKDCFHYEAHQLFIAEHEGIGERALVLDAPLG